MTEDSISLPLLKSEKFNSLLLMTEFLDDTKLQVRQQGAVCLVYKVFSNLVLTDEVTKHNWAEEVTGKGLSRI
jgi:hypothetical protein